ncbi:unnamed protein product, partial [Meganyctiphanes norvegica]
SRSCKACRTALHSSTILRRRSSRVQNESAIRAAPLIIDSSLSSREGLVLTSLYVKGSMFIRSSKSSSAEASSPGPSYGICAAPVALPCATLEMVLTASH